MKNIIQKSFTCECCEETKYPAEMFDFTTCINCQNINNLEMK